MPVGGNERLLADAGLTLVSVEDTTERKARIAQSRHDARARHERDLRRVEGDETYGAGNASSSRQQPSPANTDSLDSPSSPRRLLTRALPSPKRPNDAAANHCMQVPAFAATRSSCSRSTVTGAHASQTAWLSQMKRFETVAGGSVRRGVQIPPPPPRRAESRISKRDSAGHPRSRAGRGFRRNSARDRSQKAQARSGGTTASG
jgi:hypothetical protein